MSMFGPEQEILLLITYVPPLNSYAYISSGSRYLNFGPSHYLHPYLMHASSEFSGETTH